MGISDGEFWPSVLRGFLEGGIMGLINLRTQKKAEENVANSQDS